MSQLGSVQTAEQTAATHAYYSWVSGGVAPRRWAIFVLFQQKNTHFSSVRFKFTALEPFARTNLLKFESQLKN